MTLFIERLSVSVPCKYGPEVLTSITDVFNRGDNLGIPRRLL